MFFVRRSSAVLRASPPICPFPVRASNLALSAPSHSQFYSTRWQPLLGPARLAPTPHRARPRAAAVAPDAAAAAALLPLPRRAGAGARHLLAPAPHARGFPGLSPRRAPPRHGRVQPRGCSMYQRPDPTLGEMNLLGTGSEPRPRPRSPPISPSTAWAKI